MVKMNCGLDFSFSDGGGGAFVNNVATGPDIDIKKKKKKNHYPYVTYICQQDICCSFYLKELLIFENLAS